MAGVWASKERGGVGGERIHTTLHLIRNGDRHNWHHAVRQGELRTRGGGGKTVRLGRSGMIHAKNDKVQHAQVKTENETENEKETETETDLVQYKVR